MVYVRIDICNTHVRTIKVIILTYKGRDPVRTKIVIDNKIIEQVKLFNYLGNVSSYEGELDIDNKLTLQREGI